MNVLSLFAGIGGIDLGLQRAGMTIAGQVEIDPWCREVLARHWPEVPRHDDVRTCPGWWGRRPAPDVVAGGFPCQPVSTAGRRQAQADRRWLWPPFAAVVRDLRPRYVLVENVPGLLGRGLGDVLGDLAAVGYDADWDCIPACYVGAPHLRSRVWIVARACAVADAGHGPVAERARPPGREPGERPPVGDQPGAGRPAGGRADADADRVVHRRGHDGPPAVFPRADQGDARRGHALPDASQWSPEPGVGRVAHGIPRRVDRLRGLGNAVVPQVAEHVGRLIIAHDERSRQL
ncbi:MAG: DNA cytosine methyltransferase [Actinomycetia bacterium]|nr:DNA cytosine methyltransferase [Actinomycetes bacterium]